MNIVEIGFHKDLSIEDYHSSNGISKSGLIKVANSPKSYWHHYLNSNKVKESRSEDFILGDLVHLLLMEPEKLEERFSLSPLADRRTLQGKKEYLKFQETLGNKEAVTMGTSYKANSMVSAAKENKEFMSLIDGATYEASMYFEEIETGILCKSRPDIISSDYIADIKTTRDASPESFMRDCIKYGYHIQFAMAQQAYHTIFGKMVKDFFILAVEKEEPYNTAVYLMSDDLIHYGRKQMREYLEIYKECLKKNIWPSYKTQVLELPKWVKL